MHVRIEWATYMLVLNAVDCGCISSQYTAVLRLVRVVDHGIECIGTGFHIEFSNSTLNDPKNHFFLPISSLMLVLFSSVKQ